MNSGLRKRYFAKHGQFIGSLTMNNYSMIFKKYFYSFRRDIRMLTESIQVDKMSVAKNFTGKPLLIT